MNLPYTKVKDGIIIEVKVIPRSSKKEIAGVADNVVKVKLTAPPVDGAANEQLIELLSEECNIKKSSIIILKGESSRRKIVKIINPPSPPL
ncbi:MAG: YggU family protein [Nitrospirae bacterium]|nr:YggU family protein [Nitrospirota bacterium]